MIANKAIDGIGIPRDQYPRQEWCEPAEEIVHKPCLPPLPARFRLSPEFQLLLACSSLTPESEQEPHTEMIVSMCAGSIDWEAFLVLVNRHEVPAASLSRHAPECPPSGVMEKLKERKIQASGRALRYAAELLRLIRVFEEERIEVISLKGVMLSLQLFRDPGIRHLRDLDLMVRPEALDRADRLLVTNGYRRVFPDFELTRKTRTRMLSQDHHMTYCHERLQLIVELHWRLDLWCGEDVSELWNRCETVNWMGATVRQLDDDASLLFLCSHGAGHRWSSLKWLSDVSALLTKQRNQGWDRLLELAVRFDLERALAQTAVLVHWLYRVPLAEPLCALINRETLASDLACQALPSTLMDKRELLAFERCAVLKNLSYSLRLRKHLPLHVYLRKVWISSTYFKDFPLPDRLFWLHYPLRPLLWFKYRYAKSR